MADVTPTSATGTAQERERPFDFVVVGSGAGGGPLACNLARKKYRVLLIEAGGRRAPDATPDDSEVPVFHARAAENPALSWRYFVRHYGSLERSRRDWKWREEEGGIFYPRATGIGGCTVHNAMVTLSGPADDWDAIASIVDDQSWNSERMRGYFERLENCHYMRPGYISPNVLSALYDLLAKYRGNRGRHGFAGWLDTTWASPWLIARDCQLVRCILAAFLAARSSQMPGVFSFLRGLLSGTLAERLDPNHWQRLRHKPEGLALVPMAVRQGSRRSVREYVLETERAFPEYLKVWTDTLVTGVMFHRGTTSACGVKYLRGRNLYRAHVEPSMEAGVAGEVRAVHEVILAAGAFNTPQLLMLSGIGPADELRRHQIEVVVDRRGVGANLQDRYEVSVVWKMPRDFSVLAGLELDPARDDRELQRWRATRGGLYATNGVLVSLLKKSRPDVLMPDLCIFAVPGNFRGYFPGFSPKITADARHLTWLVLKAHSNNRGGSVRLRSADPRVPPLVNFSYFSEGTDQAGDDLAALVEGVKFVRGFTRCRPRGVEEVVPGNSFATDGELREFIANEAWGHHASCTCPIGPDFDPMAVLDGAFRVHGTSNLRVVDASAFPQIPGMFIAANIYMLAERATDVICSAYRR